MCAHALTPGTLYDAQLLESYKLAKRPSTVAPKAAVATGGLNGNTAVYTVIAALGLLIGVTIGQVRK